MVGTHLDSLMGFLPPQIIHGNRVFHYKPSILGYPDFWKHPCLFWGKCFSGTLKLDCIMRLQNGLASTLTRNDKAAGRFYPTCNYEL